MNHGMQGWTNESSNTWNTLPIEGEWTNVNLNNGEWVNTHGDYITNAADSYGAWANATNSSNGEWVNAGNTVLDNSASAYGNWESANWVPSTTNTIAY